MNAFAVPSISLVLYVGFFFFYHVILTLSTSVSVRSGVNERVRISCCY